MHIHCGIHMCTHAQFVFNIILYWPRSDGDGYKQSQTVYSVIYTSCTQGKCTFQISNSMQTLIICIPTCVYNLIPHITICILHQCMVFILYCEVHDHKNTIQRIKHNNIRSSFTQPTEAVISMKNFLILEGQGAVVVVIVTCGGFHSMK